MYSTLNRACRHDFNLWNVLHIIPVSINFFSLSTMSWIKLAHSWLLFICMFTRKKHAFIIIEILCSSKCPSWKAFVMAKTFCVLTIPKVWVKDRYGGVYISHLADVFINRLEPFICRNIGIRCGWQEKAAVKSLPLVPRYNHRRPLFTCVVSFVRCDRGHYPSPRPRTFH